jgi:hypothetical protein
MISRLIHNALDSYITTVAGSIVGVPDIIEGFTTKNWTLLIKGIGEFLIGMACNEKGIH